MYIQHHGHTIINILEFMSVILLIISVITPTAKYFMFSHLFLIFIVSVLKLFMLKCNSGITRIKYTKESMKIVKPQSIARNLLGKVGEFVAPYCTHITSNLNINARLSQLDRQRRDDYGSRLWAKVYLRHVECLCKQARALTW